MITWDHPNTAAAYEAFCEAHPRYTIANRHLIRHAALAPGQHILDLAAGTGRTAEAALPSIGPTGVITAVEPAAAMRKLGRHRVQSPQVHWQSKLPPHSTRFHRILCGAAIWQFPSIPTLIQDLAARLHPGGALVFNIPALYLLEPDTPGAGPDPLLLALPALLMDPKAKPGTTPAVEPPNLDAACRDAGLRPRRWSFSLKLTQQAYAAWLKIPILTETMMPGIDPAERARRIDSALQTTGSASWKWERWKGFTAWK